MPRFTAYLVIALLLAACAGQPVSGPPVDRAGLQTRLQAGHSLAGLNLSGADLHGLDLSDLDLSGASLRGACISSPA